MATTKKKKPAAKAKAQKPKISPEEKAAATAEKKAATAAKKAAAAEAKAAAAETKKTAAPKVQTIYDAMLTGHAWHFGKYKTKNNVRELIPATMEDLKEIAAEYLEANKTLIHSDDLEEAEHLCTILTLVRKAAR